MHIKGSGNTNQSFLTIKDSDDTWQYTISQDGSGNARTDLSNTSGSSKVSGISFGGNLNASSVVTGGLWEGRIYEVLVFNQSLSDNDRDLLWDYLNTKHSIY